VAQVRPTTLTRDKAKDAEPTPVSEADSPQPVNGGAAAEASPTPSTSAAEMPQAGDIPIERRRLRLLDRITNLAKE
jgi:hypothetical protein